MLRSKYLLRLLNTDRFMPHMTLGQFTTEGEDEVLKALYQVIFCAFVPEKPVYHRGRG
jgi:hypothetical protein